MINKEIEEALKNLKQQLENIKIANECGLATKGEFKEDIKAIENILADRERLIKENEEKLNLLNKMKNKYKLALFMVIRNSTVLPKGIELQKSSKEISQMSYETMSEVLTMIDFKTAEKMYKEGKSK